MVGCSSTASRPSSSRWARLAYNAGDRPGLADALEAVQEYGFGWLILLAIALGLVAFGLYSLAEARYRHVSPG